MTILNRNNQSGRSMIEMLGVLAIIGVLSVGGISGYSKAMAKYKLTRAQDQITLLLMNIRTAYASSPNYAGLSAAHAAMWNLAPSDMYSGTPTSSTTLYNTFGSEVEVASTGADDIHFAITMTGLSSDACRSLASSDWGADGLVSITVGGSAYSGTDLPISLGTASTACEDNGSITWEYY